MRAASKLIVGGGQLLRQNFKALDARKFSSVAEQYGVFPRESEGNNYDVNWSLTEDGVVPTGDAFRNARVALLGTRLPKKVEAGKVELTKPAYSGTYSVKEAGDSISHDAFNDLLAAQQGYLSSGMDLFVEDAGVGASASVRVGSRVVTDSAAAAIIARTLMIPVPPRPVDHRARFHGWNFDERWAAPELKWNGAIYKTVQNPAARPGQRPVVAFYGGAGNHAAVQFVERSGAIVGANVTVGGEAPVRALVDAVGHAATVLINSTNAGAIALPSVSVSNGKETVVVIGGDDSVVEAGAAKGLYGAYHNVLTAAGVSSLWNGFVAPAGSAKAFGGLPTVVVGGKAAHASNPVNMVFPATKIVFFEKGARSGSISEDDAVKRLVALTDDSKAAVAAAIVKGAKLSVAGSASDAI